MITLSDQFLLRAPIFGAEIENRVLHGVTSFVSSFGPLTQNKSLIIWQNILSVPHVKIKFHLIARQMLFFFSCKHRLYAAQQWRFFFPFCHLPSSKKHWCCRNRLSIIITALWWKLSIDSVHGTAASMANAKNALMVPHYVIKNATLRRKEIKNEMWMERGKDSFE